MDTSTCTFDEWGFVNCTDAGCPGTKDMPYPCWNLFQSIPGSMYFTLVNLFGEFPLIDQHSVWGKLVGTTVAVFAVAVFAVPAGIIGNGFEDLLTRRREENQDTKKGLDVTAERHESRSVAADGIILPT